MKGKDVFFANLFLISFLTCGTLVAGNTLSKSSESSIYNSHIAAQAGEKSWQKIEVPETKEEYDGQIRGRDETAEDKAVDDRIDEKEQAGFIEDGISEKAAEDKEITDNILAAEASEGVNTGEGNLCDEVTETVPDATTEADYFSDAFFIGDSRTVGIMEYGDIENADFFAESGMHIFNLEKKTIAFPGEGKLTFEEALVRRQYGKIYLMLGINELGYPFESIQKKYGEVVETIKSCQPNAILYLCANLHVTADQSKKDKIYNNENINHVNKMISELVDNEHTFFIDVNEVFDDSEGNLSTEYSSDAFHVYGRHYRKWADWLRTKEVVVLNEDEKNDFS